MGHGEIILSDCMLACSVMLDSSTPWTVACQAPLSVIFQERIMEWVAISFPGGSSWPSERTRVSCGSCFDRPVLYHWATWEALLPEGKGNRKGFGTCGLAELILRCSEHPSSSDLVKQLMGKACVLTTISCGERDESQALWARLACTRSKLWNPPLSVIKNLGSLSAWRTSEEAPWSRFGCDAFEGNTCVRSAWNTSFKRKKGSLVLDWPKSLFGFSYKMVWNNPSELFGQPDIFPIRN